MLIKKVVNMIPMHFSIIEVTSLQAWAIALACVMMLADIATGFIVAFINNEISSTKMREGLGHKALLIMLITVCFAIELAAKHAVQIPYDIPTCEAVCAYIVVMELISVLENIKKGYPEFADSPLFKIFNLEDKDNESEDE